jgi:hypothetical protein
MEWNKNEIVKTFGGFRPLFFENFEGLNFTCGFKFYLSRKIPTVPTYKYLHFSLFFGQDKVVISSQFETNSQNSLITPSHVHQTHV